MIELNKSYTLMCNEAKKEDKEFLNELCESRPEPNRSIDQIFMFSEFMYLQAVLLKDLVKDKDLIFVGDGDHISVALAKLAQPKSITVLDIDSRILENINNWGEKLNLKINTFQYNIFDPLPKQFANKFDLFYINPPFGSKNKGKSVIDFAKRGIEAIRSDGYGCLVIPYQIDKKWTVDNSFNIEKFVISTGFVIESKANDLHLYDLKTEPDLTSGNLIIKRIKHTKQTWEGKNIIKCKNFY